MANELSFVSNEDTQKLCSYLYQGCNILRGPIYPEEYKTYIFPLLFYKRLCDEYTRETNAALEESDGDMQCALFPENHRFIIPEGSHWNDVRNKTENIGFAIQTAFCNIERANHKSLITIFNDFDDAKWSNKDRLTDERLKNLLEHFSSLNLDDAHCPDGVLGQAYEYLIKKFADLTNKKTGKFYTSGAIVSLLVRIVDPQSGETVYDPAYIFRDQLRTFDCVISNPPLSLENWGNEAWESDKYGRHFLGIPTVVIR